MAVAKTRIEESLRVRMYRVGYGDCVLVSLPTPEGIRHVLVDCGVHGVGDANALEQVVRDVGDETGRRLAAVVASNAHCDNISGFGRFADAFGRFEIGEVWLPWVENPADPVASRVRARRQSLAERLRDHFEAVGAPDEVKALVANVAGNGEALRALRAGFGTSAEVRYLTAGDAIRGPIPGLTAEVLGPARDLEFVGKVDPAGAQRAMRAGANGAAEPVDAVLPFAAKWRVDPDDYGPKPPALPPDAVELLRMLADWPLDDLAFALDRAVNNTSLVLLLVYRGQHLLFPGDAQHESWKRWALADEGADLLGRVTFYKAAHHGSRHATPAEALARMRAGRFAAMVSTQRLPWPEIPSETVMSALEERTESRVVRTDSLPVGDAPDGPPMYSLPEGFKRGPFWYDYTVAL